jgi:2-polyprenyl-3-methyl-5-hydroxy-6-metoxy-1,4-benzoquinol methylase
MLDPASLAALRDQYPFASHVFDANSRAGWALEDSTKQLTAESFAYEWEQFGAPRAQWRKNFLDYLRPHSADSLSGKRVLDVGTGSGRHAAQAARHGARVAAVDLGRSIDVARRNCAPSVLTVQAEAERLPFAPRSFDLVMAIGVLHHLPDTQRALRSIARYAAPGGHVHVYLYWRPERFWHRRVLSLVSVARVLTVRMPHRLLHAACYPFAAALYAFIVIPDRTLRRRRRGRRLAEALPLRTYADYPFGVLVNDQFDRFSAPIEHRHTRREVEQMLLAAGLEDVQVVPNHGWIGDGRVPLSTELELSPSDAPAAASGISVVVPVLNDREGLRELLDALAAQSRPPDECVVVDGGSTDGTVELLDGWRAHFPLRVVHLPGRNIAAARNAGIRAADFDWIACTDAGCVPVPGWLDAIDAARPFSDLVAGVVEVEGTTPLERVLALTHYPRTDELMRPAAWIRISHRLFGRRYVETRSGGGYLAFSKPVWKAVGGFPQKVYAGEDRAFTTAVVRSGFRTTRSPDAVVKWSPPPTWAGNASMFHTYSRGDVRFPGRGRHVGRFGAWALATRFATGGWRGRLAVAGGALAYIALPIARARRAGLPRHEWWRIPLVVAMKDLAQMAGAAQGTLDALRGAPQAAPSRTGVARRMRSRREEAAPVRSEPGPPPGAHSAP